LRVEIKYSIFAPAKVSNALVILLTLEKERYMVVVAQLVRALVCGTRGRRFEPGLPPKKSLHEYEGSFYVYNIFLFN
tara:strand:- start:740 stop:970 length:231 start_codon:yes stop_codon:yes gene_type:complete